MRVEGYEIVTSHRIIARAAGRRLWYVFDRKLGLDGFHVRVRVTKTAALDAGSIYC